MNRYYLDPPIEVISTVSCWSQCNKYNKVEVRDLQFLNQGFYSISMEALHINGYQWHLPLNKFHNAVMMIVVLKIYFHTVGFLCFSIYTVQMLCIFLFCQGGIYIEDTKF